VSAPNPRDPALIAESAAVPMRRRTLPERLRWQADKLISAADRHAVSEVRSHAYALKLLADELERTDG
jgi:hypothetical protein